MPRLLILLLLFTFSGCKKEKVMMIVLAHPDDETAVGGMLSKYAKTHKIVYLVASDGRYGNRLLKTTSEDSLVTIRKAECLCSARALGIPPPVFLGFHDGFGTKTGVGEYFSQTARLKDELKSRILELKPDLIITFGPDGDSGHSDHRIIGDIITELILREGWYDQYPLYYLGWTKEQAARFAPDELGYLKPKYFNVCVEFDKADENRSIESIKCHKSQYTSNEINDWIRNEQADATNILYFRKFSTDKTVLKTAF